LHLPPVQLSVTVAAAVVAIRTALLPFLCCRRREGGREEEAGLAKASGKSDAGQDVPRRGQAAIVGVPTEKGLVVQMVHVHRRAIPSPDQAQPPQHHPGVPIPPPQPVIALLV